METLATAPDAKQRALSRRKSGVDSPRLNSGRRNRYSDQLTPEFDPNTYIAGQSLASILNNPHAGKHALDPTSWSNWFLSDASLESAPPLPTRPLPDFSKADFRSYLNAISDAFSRFEDVQEHSSLEEEQEPSTSSSHGEGLAACLREIPAFYFEEDFALEKGATFQVACPFSTIPQNVMLQEKLSHYLDVVEVHLVREISARSESFYEAQRQVEDLNGKLIEASNQARELRGMIQLVDADLVQSAEDIHVQSVRRDNLLSLHDKLKLMTYVNQAVIALRILVAATDCTGALDVIDELQQLLEGDDLVGMHCFRQLADQLASSTETINSMLAADFVRIAVHASRDLENSEILLSLNLRDKLELMSSEIQADEEAENGLREKIEPLVIGLLRTSKLPAVLKVYKETLTTDLKSAIKTVLAECLPALLARSCDDDGRDASKLSLAEKLRKLDPPHFVELLVAVFKVTQSRLVRAAKIRHLIEEIMQGSYTAPAVAAAFASGAAAVAAAEAAQEQEQGSLPVLARSVTDSDPLATKGSRGAQLSNISKQFRADVLRENTESLWAACDTGHGRWSKLLGVRAAKHAELRLEEFVNIHHVTQEFIAATEKVGGRLGYSIRGILQSQCKNFVDTQHASRITKMTAVLDQETWIAADVPDEFQDIVDKLMAGCPESEVVSNGLIVHEEQPDSGRKEHNGILADGSLMKTKRSSLKIIMIKGVGYHMVNSGLILLKTVLEYVDISTTLPAMAAEVVHRLAEILKLFNSRSCQLVLGAGALQVSGLKSITAKHLALASQTISFFQVLIPGLKTMFSAFIPEARKTLLLNELDRVAQDFKVHRQEIHTKLVQIMKERLLNHLRALPQLVEAWNKASDDSDLQPSQFARTLTKEVGVLHKVLTPLLLEADIRSIFTRVVSLFHTQLAESFSALDLTTPQANRRLFTDISHILACIRALPSENEGKPGELEAFIDRKFGDTSSPPRPKDDEPLS